jgi:DNA end-binding protein Ku
MARKRVELKVVKPTDSEKEEGPRKKHSFPPGGRPLWSGSISFGLVNVPVRMVPGVKHNDIRFHLLHDKDNARLKRKYVCSVENKEVPPDEIKKGYEISPDRHVIMEEEELKALAPKASRTIDLLYFVHIEDVDPVYFETPYYLLPGANAEKAYMLLCEAMKSTNRAAISEIIVRGREYLAAVRPVDHVLALDTMRYPNEVIFPGQLPWKPPAIKIAERELKAAKDLVESLEDKFHPEKLKDDYREMVLKAIQRKAKGNKIVSTPHPDQEEEATNVTDLMSALQKSLERSSQKKAKATA